MASADCSVFTQTVKLTNFVNFKLYLVRKAKPFIQAALQLRTGEPRQCDPAVLTPPVSPAVALGPVKSNKKTALTILCQFYECSFTKPAPDHKHISRYLHHSLH